MKRSNWLGKVKKDPTEMVLASGFEPIIFFYKRDILEEEVSEVTRLWDLKEPKRILSAQQSDGSWRYSGGKDHIRSRKQYDMLETYRKLGILIEKYGFDNRHGSIRDTAEFLFSFQTAEGDLRGIYSRQYSPNYTAGIIELLIKAGYEEDKRTLKCFRWLISFRQNDGGWAIPFRTKADRSLGSITKIFSSLDTVYPDRDRPFSHLATGVVLRAFSAHGHHRKSEVAKKAGKLLKKRFFKPDRYPDRKTVKYWTKIRYPFWYTDILSSLDSLSKIGFSNSDPDIEKGLVWLLRHQSDNGLWHTGYLKAKDKEKDIWVTLAVCRVLKRFYG